VTPDARKALVRAAQVIDELGWTQRAFTTPAGCVCLLGALRVALGARRHRVPLVGLTLRLPEPAYDTYAEAADAVRRYLGVDCDEWNDRPGRTAAQVTEALRTTAAAA
jgi:hypothetical protein